MSYQSGDACFPTALAANTASAARMQGSIKQIGTAQYVVDVSAVTDSTISYAFRDVATSSTISSTETVNPVPCQLLSMEDAVEVGWQIALSWFVTYGVVFLIRVIRDEMRGSHDDYGNA